MSWQRIEFVALGQSRGSVGTRMCKMQTRAAGGQRIARSLHVDTPMCRSLSLSLARSSSLSPPLSRSLSFFLTFFYFLSLIGMLPVDSFFLSCRLERGKKRKSTIFFSLVLSGCFLSTFPSCWFFHPIDSFFVLTRSSRLSGIMFHRKYEFFLFVCLSVIGMLPVDASTLSCLSLFFSLSFLFPLSFFLSYFFLSFYLFSLSCVLSSFLLSFFFALFLFCSISVLFSIFPPLFPPPSSLNGMFPVDAPLRVASSLSHTRARISLSLLL